jgi:hypothetical protein
MKRMFAEGMNGRTFTFSLLLYGGCGHVLIGAFFLPSVPWASLPVTLLPVLVYAVVIATFASWSLSVFATTNLPASVSSLGITLQSFFSPLLGAIFLGEVVTWVDVMGGMFIVVGIVVVVWAKGREGKQAQVEAKIKALTVGEGEGLEKGMAKSKGEESVSSDHSDDDDDVELSHSSDEGSDDDSDHDDDGDGEERSIELGRYVGHMQRDQQLASDDAGGI